MGNFKFGRTSQERLSTVDREMQDVAELALKISPFDFGIPQYGGLRTASEQNTLYKKGRSKCDGYKIKSLHQTGRALDFIPYVDGAYSNEKHHLAVVGAAFLRAAMLLGKDLEWGGLWGWDYYHVQFPDKKPSDG